MSILKINEGPGKTAYSPLKLFENSLLLVVIAFLAIVIIKIIVSLNFYAPIILPDEYLYDSNAHLLSDGRLYPSMGAMPPMYPLILSVPYHFFQDKNAIYHVMLCLSGIISTLIIFPAYFILKKYVATRYAIIGAIAITTMPVINLFSQTLMLENLFIPLVLFALWAVIEAFDTNRFSWQIIAGTSLASLEITRSIGQIIEYSFLLAFLIYLLINRRSAVSKLFQKLPLLLSFTLVFGLWHLFLRLINTAVVQTQNGTVGSAGTSNNALGMFSSIGFAFQSYPDFIFSIKVLINHFNYISLASYLIPVFILYYLIFYRKGKIVIDNGYRFGGLFILISTVSMIFCVTIIDIGFLKVPEIHFAIGRYLDPLLPPIFIFGLVSIYRSISSDLKSRFVQYFIFMEATVLIVAYVSTYTQNVIYNPNDYINNPSLTYLIIIDYWYYPLAIMAITVLSIILVYFAVIEKRAIILLLLFVVCTSIIFSYLTFDHILNGSVKTTVKNDISLYIQKTSNDKTTILVDKNLTEPELKVSEYIYNFWNYGKFQLIDINDSNLSVLMHEDNVYLITAANTSYLRVAIDNQLKLYYKNDCQL